MTDTEKSELAEIVFKGLNLRMKDEPKETS